MGRCGDRGGDSDTDRARTRKRVRHTDRNMDRTPKRLDACSYATNTWLHDRMMACADDRTIERACWLSPVRGGSTITKSAENWSVHVSANASQVDPTCSTFVMPGNRVGCGVGAHVQFR
jgi:hypothetical protein